MNWKRVYQHLLPIPKEYEKIAFIVKAHWFEFVAEIMLFLLLSAIPPAAYYFAARFEPELLNTQWLSLIFILGGSAWYLFNLLLFFTNFTDFFLDVWIVTNERIVAINQRGLFARDVTQTRLYQVQDVKTEVRGPIQTLANFGDVIVQTAGTAGKLVFDNVPHPNEIARKIMELVEGDRQYHAEKIKMLKLEETPKIIDSGA